MLDLSIDMTAFQRKARQLGAAQDQVPFAMATALTSAAFNARENLIGHTWPTHVQSRDSNFLKAALRVEKATKRDLNVAVTSGNTAAGKRAHLVLHADGGVKQAQKRLAIPPSTGRGQVTRTSRGVRANQRPKAIVSSIPKRALRITPRGIFEGYGGKLNLRYAFAPSAHVKADVPFRSDFKSYMTNEINRTLPDAVKRAMRTRR